MQTSLRSLLAMLLLCSATHIHADVRVRPLYVNFYDQPLGVVSGPVETMLTNESDEAVTVQGLDLSPQEPFARAGGTCGTTPFSLGPRASCTLAFTFRPYSTGEVETTMRYFWSGGNASFWLSGKGVAGDLDVQPFGGIRFFPTRVGETSNVQSAQLSNTGDGVMYVLSISDVAAPFVRVGGSCETPPFSLHINQSCSLDYTFSPVEVAESRQTVRFTSTAPGSPPSLDLAGDSDPGNQTLTFPAQSPSSRGYAANGTFAIDPLATSATPNGGEPIVYSSLTANICSVSGTTVTMLALGTCTLAADQAATANYDAAAQVTSQVQLIARSDADLWVEKTSDVAQAGVGDVVAYTIRVGNHGPFDAAAVNLLDLPPDRLGGVVWQCTEAIGAACPQPSTDDGGIDVTLDLPNGASVRFELLGTVLPAPGAGGDATLLLNTASVSLQAGSSLFDPDGSNNDSSANVSVISYDLHADGFEVLPQR